MFDECKSCKETDENICEICERCYDCIDGELDLYTEKKRKNSSVIMCQACFNRNRNK